MMMRTDGRLLLALYVRFYLANTSQELLEEGRRQEEAAVLLSVRVGKCLDIVTRTPNMGLNKAL